MLNIDYWCFLVVGAWEDKISITYYYMDGVNGKKKNYSKQQPIKFLCRGTSSECKKNRFLLSNILSAAGRGLGVWVVGVRSCLIPFLLPTCRSLYYLLYGVRNNNISRSK